MPVSYEVSRTFRLSGDDDRNLREIQEALGLNQADAMRFALEAAKHLMAFAVENDPKAVFVEQQYQRGRITFVEKLTPEELADALIYVRERIGQATFDKLLAHGQDLRERDKRNDEWFAKAKNQLIAHKEPPYAIDEICRTISQVSGCNLSYAKSVFDKHWRSGDMQQSSVGKYAFLSQTSKVKEVVK